MSKHAYDYGEDCVTKLTVNKLVQRAGLSDIDVEILFLRFTLGWNYVDIAVLIGQKYYGKGKDDTPLWDRSIRHRVERSIRKLRAAAQELAVEGIDGVE
jgi:hypothetical protein